MIETVKREVYKLLGQEDSGHDDSHIGRVVRMSLEFAKEENANKEIVALIALLHDVDDYKLVSSEDAANLTNTKRIMNIANVDSKTQEIVISELKRIGYSKSLDGIRPLTIEGKIVSDADMCDASGVNGVIRSFKYNLKHGGSFFNRNIFPTLYNNSKEYKESKSTTVVNHMFEKILKLKSLMLTDAGKKEASIRHEVLVNILYNLFNEEDANEWKEYLDNYLADIEK